MKGIFITETEKKLMAQIAKEEQDYQDNYFKRKVMTDDEKDFAEMILGYTIKIDKAHESEKPFLEDCWYEGSTEFIIKAIHNAIEIGVYLNKEKNERKNKTTN